MLSTWDTQLASTRQKHSFILLFLELLCSHPLFCFLAPLAPLALLCFFAFFFASLYLCTHSAAFFMRLSLWDLSPMFKSHKFWCKPVFWQPSHVFPRLFCHHFQCYPDFSFYLFFLLLEIPNSTFTTPHWLYFFCFFAVPNFFTFKRFLITFLLVLGS